MRRRIFTEYVIQSKVLFKVGVESHQLLKKQQVKNKCHCVVLKTCFFMYLQARYTTHVLD